MQEQYLSKVDYPYLLLLRIMKVLDAIDFGKDAQSETENLISILKPNWLDSIRHELEDKERTRDDLIIEKNREHGKIGTQSYQKEIKQIHQGFARWVVQKVIAIMDKNKMLLIEQKQLREGGYL